MAAPAFDYSNSSGRAPGRIPSLLALVLPGVRAVQAQTLPYARAWETHNRAAAAAAGPLWVVLGDSMAQGIGAATPEGGWAGRLAAHLPGFRMINLSVTGARLADVLDRQIPVLDELRPLLVTMVAGSNDLFSRPSDAAARMRAVLDRLPAGTVVGNQPGPSPTALALNREIDAAVAGRGLVLAEFRDPRMRSWRGKLAADHFHPNDLGYAGMAAILAEALQGGGLPGR